jgi:dUTP pyrophosphatase
MQNLLQIKVLNKSKNRLPYYASSGASCMDVLAFLENSIIVKPFDRVLIPTGLYFEIPEGYEIQVRSRSGLCLNNGIIVANSPGTIDSDYRGELKVIILNISKNDFEINNSDRIAQIVFSEYKKVNLIISDSISSTQRMEKSFGSTGI